MRQKCIRNHLLSIAAFMLFAGPLARRTNPSGASTD
jgi:hypothetical protein